ncbi:MAG: hypothetical protein ACXU9F_08800 [Syntrophales bacterium]
MFVEEAETRTHVEFRSAKFSAYPPEEEKVNPDLWGKRLAEYLHRELKEEGIETEEIYPEDWGWVVPIHHEPFSLWVGCGHYQKYPDGYLVFIEPSKPTIRKGLFKKIDTTDDVEKVAVALDRILRSDPEINHIRWWAEDEK